MSKFSNISGKNLIKFVTSIGYKCERQNRGNHRIFVHDYRKTITIPVYKKKIVKIGLLCGILKDIGISRIEFIKFID
ncbi:type II toxin-antitoxin system HicA family toxin [Aliarcobacter cryaerophilus]